MSEDLDTLLDRAKRITSPDYYFIRDLADALSTIREKLAAVEGERDAARQALEHDRAKVITACNQFNDAFARRSWLLDSRGPYEWDDDRYRDEFRGAYDELAAPMVTLTAIGKDWANCPTNHDEIMRSRQDQKARAEAAEARATAAEAERDDLAQRAAVIDEALTNAVQLRAAAEAREAELRTAISWIEAPFVDESTSIDELRFRVTLCVTDAARAALTKEPGK